MTIPPLAIQAARRQLEAAYGLALEGLGDEQVSAAIEAAAEDPWVDPADPRFLARVVDRLPIDESWLFREDALWEWIRDEAGPAMLAAALEAGRQVRVLSLGCSAGQEPFSAALLFQGLLEQAGIPPSAASAYVRIVGVDSSPARVELARSGAVPAWSVQRCREDWLRARVVPEEGSGGRWRIDGSTRAMCRFDVGNLVELAERGPGALAGFDLVLCRHVLIYFRPSEAERLAAGLARGLDPGAVLVFSAAEAHLLAAGGLSPLGHLGAGRRGGAPASAPRRRNGKARRPALRSPPAARPRAESLPRPPAAPPGSAVDGHIRGALEHAHAGRHEEALREARAALFHDPRNLYSRMLVGRHLIVVDAPRGREVLRELLASAARLPADAAVPNAEGLSVGQLADAVRILLERPEAP